MDIQQYIASGILEQYAFGLLSPSERSEVEANLQQYPELVLELRQIEHALEEYLSVYQSQPSPGFKAALDQRLKDINPDPAPGNTSTGGNLNWLSGLFLLSLAAASWLFYSNYQKDQNYQQLQAEYQILKEDCDETNEVNRGLLEQLQTRRQPNTELIQMRGTPNAPTAIASVIYNTETRKVYLDAINLPEPAADKQYQLWAIVDGGAPESMGVFDIVPDLNRAMQEVPFVEGANITFAVTLEPLGGSVEPTLDAMVVAGSITIG